MKELYMISFDRLPYYPRKCGIISRFKTKYSSDCALVKIDPPFPPEFVSNYQAIDHVGMVTRYSGSLFWPRFMLGWPLHVRVYYIKYQPKNMSYVDTNDLIEIDGGGLFPSREMAILNYSDSFRESDNNMISALMDNSDIIKVDKANPTWKIKLSDSSSTVPFYQRRMDLLRRILHENPNPYFLSNRNPKLSGLTGFWKEIDGLYIIPPNIRLDLLYQWLNAENWMIFDKPKNWDIDNIQRSVESTETQLFNFKTLTPRFLLSSNSNDEWFISVQRIYRRIIE